MKTRKTVITYENLLYQIRPAFGGNIVATIINPEHRPQMATVREGVMKKEIVDANYQGEVIRHDVAKYVPETDYVVKVIDRHVEKAKTQPERCSDCNCRWLRHGQQGRFRYVV